MHVRIIGGQSFGADREYKIVVSGDEYHSWETSSACSCLSIQRRRKLHCIVAAQAMILRKPQ